MSIVHRPVLLPGKVWRPGLTPPWDAVPLTANNTYEAMYIYKTWLALRPTAFPMPEAMHFRGSGGSRGELLDGSSAQLRWRERYFQFHSTDDGASDSRHRSHCNLQPAKRAARRDGAIAAAVQICSCAGEMWAACSGGETKWHVGAGGDGSAVVGFTQRRLCQSSVVPKGSGPPITLLATGC